MDADKAMKTLHDLMVRINATDNRSTASPFLIILQERVLRPAGEYEDADMTLTHDPSDDTDYKSLQEFMGAHDVGLGTEEQAERDKLTERWHRLPSVKYKYDWEDKAHFLTMEGVEEHLRLNKHNYRGETRTFIAHMFRNPEMASMLEAIGVLAGVPWRGAR